MYYMCTLDITLKNQVQPKTYCLHQKIFSNNK